MWLLEWTSSLHLSFCLSVDGLFSFHVKGIVGVVCTVDVHRVCLISYSIPRIGFSVEFYRSA